jgi:glycosyltransferase involved in cell wall biosynthesis
MQLMWISGRNLSADLAATTEINLCREISGMGIEVTLVSPGKIDSNNFKHKVVKGINFPGLKTISGARNIRNNLRNGGLFLPTEGSLLVDWRYVKSLKKELIQFSGEWSIIDRGPPTYQGLFNRLQKKYWFDAWKIANKHAKLGFVVSKQHKQFVMERTGVEIDTRVVPAGTIKNPYSLKKCFPGELLKIVYIGRVDRRRGVEGVIPLSRNLEDQGMKHNIKIIGKGDFGDEISKASKMNENIEYFESLSRTEIPKILAESHIGIMPMPDIPVWRIASPIKLAEYLSAGLAVIGPSHLGNQLNGGEEWDLLSENDWIVESSELIKGAISDDWGRIVSSSVLSSKELMWEGISTKMIEDLGL